MQEADLRPQQEVALSRLAKALIRGDREYARRLLHALLREPKARITQARRVQLEVWLQQLKTPDPEYGKAELMTLLLKNTLPETLADFLDREIQQYSDWLERMSLERDLIQAVSVARRRLKQRQQTGQGAKTK